MPADDDQQQGHGEVERVSARYGGAMRPLGDDVAAGTRVKVLRDPDWDGPWPSEPSGTIADNFDIPFAVIDLADRTDISVPDEDRRTMRTFMVRFDEPAQDSEEGGPYYMAEVWEKYLRLLD
jgi:hypothetical protein